MHNSHEMCVLLVLPEWCTVSDVSMLMTSVLTEWRQRLSDVSVYAWRQVSESLDGLIDELSYLRDQTNNAEPITSNPPDIHDQLADAQVSEFNLWNFNVSYLFWSSKIWLKLNKVLYALTDLF